MFIADLFNEDAEDPQDPRAHLLFKQARVQFPLAKTDAEALAMYMASKEVKDVERIDGVNDREDAMIDQLSALELSLDQKVGDLQSQVNQLRDRLTQKKSNSKVTEVYVSAKEKKRNPDVKVGQLVAIKDPRTQHTLTFGKFMRVGPSGLAHIELNAPLKDDGIVPEHLVGTKHVAVPPAWLFANAGDAWPDEPWLARKKSELAAKAKGEPAPAKEPKQGELKLK